jgi:hypothetical protein
MAFKRIGNETREWQRGNSNNCDSGRVRETRAELERIA